MADMNKESIVTKTAYTYMQRCAAFKRIIDKQNRIDPCNYVVATQNTLRTRERHL